MSGKIKSPFKVDARKEDMRKKMIELCLNKACESELNALYYTSIAESEESPAGKAKFNVQADGLRQSAEQQRQMAEFLESSAK